MFIVRVTAVIVEPAGISGNIKREHTAAEFTHSVLTGEEVQTSAVAVIAFSRVILVEGVVFAWRDGGHLSGQRGGTGTAKHSYQ